MIRVSIAFTCLLIMISCTQMETGIKEVNTGIHDINTDIQDINMESAYPESVARARQLPDDSWVSLTGKIIKNLGDNQYIFQDSSDEIKITVTDQAWNGLSFNPKTKVKITGKVDITMHGIQINIANIEKLAE